MSENFDEVGCLVGPNRNALRVWVIDQADADTGEFDEHKCLVGFASRDDALDAYRRSFSDGRANERIGKITGMTMRAFKRWLGYGNPA